MRYAEQSAAAQQLQNRV